jgi:hypothetical protein
MQAVVGNVNSDTAYISTPGSLLKLEPFYTEGHESWASVLERAAAYGDSAFAEWYCRLIHSENAASPDGKPVIEVATYPALTDYDYGVRLDDETLESLHIVRSLNNVRNWIVTQYRDIDDERDVVLTPDDDANLTDSTSTTDWGQRNLVYDVGRATTTTATNIGRRLLARLKDPRFYIEQPIPVVGYALAKNGNPIPASELQAGKRVRILNFLDDLVGTSGAGLTEIVTKTTYNDQTETALLYTGVPDDMAVIMAQLKLRFG